MLSMFCQSSPTRVLNDRVSMLEEYSNQEKKCSKPRLQALGAEKKPRRTLDDDPMKSLHQSTKFVPISTLDEQEM